MPEKQPSPGVKEGDDPTAFRPTTARPAASAPGRSAVQGLGFAAPNDNPIMRAAGPLLLLLGRLRAGLLRAPAQRLAPQIAAAIETCERDMTAAGVPPTEANRAKSALCATADEVLASLPEADRASAAEPGLMTRFFGQSNGGRRFFDELKRAKADPETHYQLLELFLACLALGFEGPRQTLPSAGALLQDVRQDLYELLQKAAPVPPRELSPHWQGQTLASRAVRARTPFWTAAALICLVLFGVFTGLRIALAHRAEAAAEALISLNPRTRASIGRKVAVAPPSPTLTPSAQLEHIRTVLEPNIAAGTLSVDATANQLVIRIADRVLFQPGRATLLDDARPLMTYIALALDDDSGAVKVVGRSDDRRISNARFASNFELSLERAKVVAALLKRSLSHPERVEAEGKGADAPIAANDTAEGRDANRRVEIIVPRAD